MRMERASYKIRFVLVLVGGMSNNIKKRGEGFIFLWGYLDMIKPFLVSTTFLR